MAENKDKRTELSMDEVEEVVGGTLSIRSSNGVDGIVWYDIDHNVLGTYRILTSKSEVADLFKTTYWNLEGDGTRDQQMLDILRAGGHI